MRKTGDRDIVSGMGTDVGAALRILEAHGVIAKSFKDKRAVLIAAGTTTTVEYTFHSSRRFDRVKAGAWRTEAASRGTKLLVIVGGESDNLRAAAVADQFSFVALRERSWFDPRVHVPALMTSPSGWGYASCALVRVLMATSTPALQGRSKARSTSNVATGQLSLADRTGVAQSSVSDLLPALVEERLVRHVDGGWIGTDFLDMWDWHMENYPGQGGARLTWRSRRAYQTQEKDLRAVVNAAVAADAERDEEASMLWSGVKAMPASFRSDESKDDFPLLMLSDYLTTDLAQRNYTACAERIATVQLIELTDPKATLTAAAWGAPGQTDPLLTAYELARDPGHRALVDPYREWVASQATLSATRNLG